jgi:FkbM family methyltransferase
VFLSYAQNFEDVMLWRALRHVANGFYIDIGAGWSAADSVTKAFYDRGWSGINIEPNPACFEDLVRERPRDINLSAAVADAPGTAELNVVSVEGLSTLDGDIARSHELKGRSLSPVTVTITTLNAIWERHIGNRDVHFLKVDVEGFEAKVLRGNRWSTQRPWVVVVEATHPEESEPNHESWEPILLAADYRFAYADGLNRFYVAFEHGNLLPAFAYPPNVFDDFRRYTDYDHERRAHAAEGKLTAVYKSRSWKITEPLRWITSKLRKGEGDADT